MGVEQNPHFQKLTSTLFGRGRLKIEVLWNDESLLSRFQRRLVNSFADRYPLGDGLAGFCDDDFLSQCDFLEHTARGMGGAAHISAYVISANLSRIPSGLPTIGELSRAAFAAY